MINKAPKDMTAVEFVEYLIARKKDEKVLDVNVYYTLEFLKGRLNEPAQNPFTPDQLAWMREEQRNGYRYAARDRDGNCYLFTQKPIKEDRCWGLEKQDHRYSDRRDGFLEKILSFDDPEPLCFADYAPLGENK